MTLGKSTRAHALMDHLRQQIVESKIAPGEKLPSENELVAEHGVSRTVVREALLRLQSGGYIHTRRGAGSYALVPPSEGTRDTSFPAARTLQERMHLLTFRAAIESEAAALCAKNSAAELVPVLAEAIEAFEASGSVPSLAMEHDYTFHTAIANGSGNPYLRDALVALGPAMITMPHQRLDNTVEQAGEYEGAMRRVGREHQMIVEAILDGDQLAAAAAMRSHLENSRRRLECSDVSR